VSCIIFSCAPSMPFSDVEKKQVEKEARATLEQYYADVRKDGLMAEFRYLDSSREFFWVPPGYASPLSYDSVKTILKQNAGLFRLIDNSFESLAVMPLSREAAVYTGRLRSLSIDTSGTRQISLLMETGFLQKRKEGWKLVGGQTNFLKTLDPV